jgi:hypothetical protein
MLTQQINELLTLVQLQKLDHPAVLRAYRREQLRISNAVRAYGVGFELQLFDDVGKRAVPARGK